ncbi:hypothetical protein [Calothrix sp. 336/3]|uniref:hypothetical protein n=1 Tax=Calothrix sp. 336/3 TaxID=1337936 RepID=UPI0004E3F5A5|nr:hypothetical protein [Calothrix sp. 336/3]AKG22248.1 hypothetical protein IJ00_14140 [Calothrix sp. 336/3]
MSNEDAKRVTYDRGIVPAETSARIAREGENFKSFPKKEGDESLDTTSGYTVDNEGLVNNFAVEPEIYYEEPGDLQEKQAAEAQERAEELVDINHNDETGKLTEKEDKRGKGVGMI